ncbi:unnamed protein product [Pocillopora meandrina]|uniref:Uncharacterized protein n=1 Tax=Pocillopora meandrina TaxID=46732 RepID=A0AAU9X5B0_9CNID|nr:unnamed protein product [Pocillopora meandrina]
MDLEKREQEIYIAGYLVYDIMIVENLGDHADAEVAKGVKQFTENFIKKPIEYAKLLKKAKEAAEKCKEKKFDVGKPSATKEPQQCCQKKFLSKRLVNRTRHSKRAD